MGVFAHRESTSILNTICKRATQSNLLWGIFGKGKGKVTDFPFMEKAWGKQDFLFKTNDHQI